MPADNAVIRLEDYRATPYALENLHLTFQLHPEATKVRNEMHFSQREDASERSPLILDGEDLKLISVTLNGSSLASSDYSVDDKSLTISNPPSGSFELVIETEINPTANTRLEGLYRSSNTYCTQCEAEGFRRITYFYDRPDILSRYKVRIEAEQASNPILLSNGNLISQGTLENPCEDGTWHFAEWEDPFPKPSYLFALVAGDLTCVADTFVTLSGRTVDLKIYVEHGKEDRVAYAMDALKRSIRWDEEVFGREYDLDLFQIVAVSDFNAGAMENKGLNIFNDKYILAKPETATDTDYALIETIIAHEYFHNWTGNRITCRDWFQLCLKEGLTVYRDQEFSSDMRSRAVKRIADVRTLRSRQFPEDGGPLAHPVRPNAYSEINNFYTATVYEKGAEVCRMIETLLGSSVFRAGLDLYFDRHDGDAATIEDFLAVFEEISGQDFSQFALWYSQAGTPEIVATSSYDAARKQLTLALEQTCPATPGQPTKKLMHIPIAFGLVGRDGSALTIQHTDDKAIELSEDGLSGLIHMRERQQKLVFSGIDQPAVPSLLRGFSAPVRLRSNLTQDDFKILLSHDSDAFNRWQAAQFLLVDFLTKAARIIANGEAISAAPDLVSAFGTAILDPKLEHAFRAQLLSLPSESDIARELGANVDPQAIHVARKFLRKEIATTLETDLLSLYHSLEGARFFIPDASSAGRRSLRNAVLDLLSEVSIGGDLAAEQYHSANNMTDQFAALASLVHSDASDGTHLLGSFYDQFSDDALVIDKWFSLQATTPADSTLASLTALSSHPSFDFTNPNRVMALFGSFALGNQLQFNRADGQGYRLVADVILRLDQTNPQTAARLANAFRSWKVLEPVRRDAAKAELERISSHKALSKDVSDIVTRCLH